MTGFIAKWMKMPTLAERLRTAGVRDDLVRAAERTAFGRQTDRELPRLAELLTDQEMVVQLVEGRWSKKMGLFALTTRRLLFVPSGDAPYGADIPLEELQAAAANPGSCGHTECSAQTLAVTGAMASLPSLCAFTRGLG